MVQCWEQRGAVWGGAHQQFAAAQECALAASQGELMVLQEALTGRDQELQVWLCRPSPPSLLFLLCPFSWGLGLGWDLGCSYGTVVGDSPQPGLGRFLNGLSWARNGGPEGGGGGQAPSHCNRGRWEGRRCAQLCCPFSKPGQPQPGPRSPPGMQPILAVGAAACQRPFLQRPGSLWVGYAAF